MKYNRKTFQRLGSIFPCTSTPSVHDRSTSGLFDVLTPKGWIVVGPTPVSRPSTHIYRPGFSEGRQDLIRCIFCHSFQYRVCMILTPSKQTFCSKSFSVVLCVGFGSILYRLHKPEPCVALGSRVQVNVRNETLKYPSGFFLCETSEGMVPETRWSLHTQGNGRTHCRIGRHTSRDEVIWRMVNLSVDWTSWYVYETRLSRATF